MEKVAHARTVRIGPAHKCGVFEAEGFVYATIMGEGLPSRSRPSGAYCKTNTYGIAMSTKEPCGVRGEGNLLSVLADSADDGVVSRNEHEPPLRNLVDALCDNDTTVSDQAVGRSSLRSELTLGKVVRGIPRKFLGKLVGCAKRKRKPSEVNPTAARYRAWDKANKKRAASNRTITHGIVYKLTSPSGKAYVGISKYSIERRILWHNSSSSCCHAIKAALRKYGFDSFTKEVLHSGVPLGQLPSLDIQEMATHGTLQPNGYNLSKGRRVQPHE